MNVPNSFIDASNLTHRLDVVSRKTSTKGQRPSETHSATGKILQFGTMGHPT